jgi:iron complex transport system substrate-binding protein
MAGCNRFMNKDGKEGNEERIVCIAKQYTEIIYALGAEKDLVAVDVSSTYPPATKKLQKVGYHRALSTEALLAAKPTLIIHDNNIGPEHVVQQLEKLKVPMQVFSKHNSTIEGTDSLIMEMGRYFGKEEKALDVCKKLQKEFNDAVRDSVQVRSKSSVVVIHFGQASNVYLTMTRKSTASKLITWAGGSIETEGDKGMTPLSAELIAKSDPDVILLTDFGYDKLGSMDKIIELPGIAGTRAAKNKRIYRVEEHDMVYLGPRTGQVISHLINLIHEGEK